MAHPTAFQPGQFNRKADVDFIKVTQKGELSATSQNRMEYFLTLDAGKLISMMTNTATTHEVRTYFIEVEKRARRAVSCPSLSEPYAISLLRREQLTLEEWQPETRQEVAEIKVNMKQEIGSSAIYTRRWTIKLRSGENFILRRISERLITLPGDTSKRSYGSTLQ